MFMRYMKGMSSKRVVDDKHWLSEDHDEMKDRAYMKRQGLAKKKLSRLRLIKKVTEKKY